MTRIIPGWISLALLAIIIVAALALVGWIKPYLTGPDLAFTTIYRPKPVPVKVETVKWLTKVKTERVEIPIEVIRTVTPAQEKRLSEFGIALPQLASEHKQLLRVFDIPKAAYGGELAVTASTESGRVDGVFLPKRAPFIALGGLREAAIDFDVISRKPGGHYRQDLVRVGPAIVTGEAFVRGGKSGAAIGVAVRF